MKNKYHTITLVIQIPGKWGFHLHLYFISFVGIWNHLTMNSDVYHSLQTKRPWLFSETWLMHDIRGPLVVGEGSNTYTHWDLQVIIKINISYANTLLVESCWHLSSTHTIFKIDSMPLNLRYHSLLIAQLRTTHIFSSCSNQLYMALIPTTKCPTPLLFPCW